MTGLKPLQVQKSRIHTFFAVFLIPARGTSHREGVQARLTAWLAGWLFEPTASIKGAWPAGLVTRKCVCSVELLYVRSHLFISCATAMSRSLLARSAYQGMEALFLLQRTRTWLQLMLYVSWCLLELALFSPFRCIVFGSQEKEIQHKNCASNTKLSQQHASSSTKPTKGQASLHF